MTDTLSPDRERDVQIAEAVGCIVKIAPWQEDDNIEAYCHCDNSEHADPTLMDIQYPFTPLRYFSTDPVAFEALLQEIGRRGLGEQYVREVAKRQWPHLTPNEASAGRFIAYDIFELMTATQDIRAAAALAVLTEGTT